MSGLFFFLGSIDILIINGFKDGTGRFSKREKIKTTLLLIRVEIWRNSKENEELYYI